MSFLPWKAVSEFSGILLLLSTLRWGQDPAKIVNNTNTKRKISLALKLLVNASTWGPAFGRFELKAYFWSCATSVHSYSGLTSLLLTAVHPCYLSCPSSQSSPPRSQHPLSTEISPVSWEAPQHLGRCRQMELHLLSAPLHSSVFTSGCLCVLATVLLLLFLPPTPATSLFVLIYISNCERP